MKILITGSNGLVGSNLSSYLKKQKDNFDIIDSNRKITNLFSFEETKKLIGESKPDLIVNCAAKVGGIFANNVKRTEFILENLKINTNILEACIPYNNIKIINLGSSCIYPLGAEVPIKESSFMTGMLEPTNSPYAMAKISAIELGRALSIQHGHKILNLMPTNLYGPNDNFSPLDSHVIPGLIYKMHNAKINNEPSFKIWGTGKPLREFLYIEDFADSIYFLIKHKWETDLLNIGSGKEVSIQLLSEIIKNTVGYSGKIDFDRSKPDGNPRKMLDSSKINELGWKAKTDLEQGINKTYKWFTENYKKIRV